MRMGTVIGFVLGVLFLGWLSADQGKGAEGRVCDFNTVARLFERQLAEENLTGREHLFSKILGDVVRRGRGDYTAISIVTYCPRFNRQMVTVRLTGLPIQLSGNGPTYGTYITAHYLRSLDDVELIRQAQRQGCMVLVGQVDAYIFMTTPELTECLYKEAVRAGDIPFAQWHARLLGYPLPQYVAR